MGLAESILRVLSSTMSPTRYAGAGDLFSLANCSCEAWADSKLVRSNPVISYILVAKSLPSLLRFARSLEAARVIARGGPKLIRGQ
jgi:hypothetical protein